jgi:glycerophosphoryl diester phosphodiesterase
MRAVRLLASFAGASLVLYLYFALLHPQARAEDHRFFLRGSGGRPLVIAHQGGRGLWPENTLFAFEHSLDLGVDVLEMDLRVTSDGNIVVHHDASVERTTGRPGLLSELTLEEVRALDAGYGFGNGAHPFRGRGLTIPTLQEVLDRFGDVRLNLEMKEFEPSQARGFCSMLRKTGDLDRFLVASFDHASMIAFRKACPEVATSATMREGLLFYQLDRLHLGSLFRSPALAFQVPEYFGDIQVLQPRFLEHARSSNVRVQVWTVNEEEDLSRMLKLGVDGILTDYPDRLLRLMGRLARTP